MNANVISWASRWIRILARLSLVAASLSMPAFGAQFCVHNSAELSAALATASTNGEDDNIKLAPGTYTPGSGGFQFHSSDLHGLSMGGGFDTPVGGVPCSLPLGGAQWSVLDGAGSNRLLEIIVSGGSAAPVFLHDLTLRNGSSVAGDPTVFVSGTSGWNGNVVIENISVRDNHAAYAVATVGANGVVIVRSSEFVGNTVADFNGGVLSLISNRPGTVNPPGTGASVFFNNNTVAGNSVPSSSHRAGFWLTGTTPGDVLMANNILWNNGGADINLSVSATAYLDRNDIGTRWLGGSVIVNESNPYQVDPQFVSADDVHLASTSPLRDGGAASPVGGAGSADLGGDPRVVFGGIDLGAYEIQDTIFKDGFE